MKTYRVIQSTVINATARKVYGILADYRNGHPQILPKEYFTGLEAEARGNGAGAKILR